MKKIIGLSLLLLASLQSYSQHTFNPVIQAVGLSVNTQNLGQAVGWGDINNDGWMDILVDDHYFIRIHTSQGAVVKKLLVQ